MSGKVATTDLVGGVNYPSYKVLLKEYDWYRPSAQAIAALLGGEGKSNLDQNGKGRRALRIVAARAEYRCQQYWQGTYSQEHWRSYIAKVLNEYTIRGALAKRAGAPGTTLMNLAKASQYLLSLTPDTPMEFVHLWYDTCNLDEDDRDDRRAEYWEQVEVGQ
jgi:hypothetical protein